MGNIESLNKVRADKHGDSRMWAPADALRDMLGCIERGEICPSQMVIHFLEEREDGGSDHHYYAAGVTFPQHLALLAIANRRAMDDWIA